MHRQFVNSSNLRSVGYENGTLEIEFHGGEVYQYLKVPENIYISLMNASSHGCYFADYIKNRYQTIRVL